MTLFRPPNSPAVLEDIKALGPLQKELLLILKEIKVITDKVFVSSQMMVVTRYFFAQVKDEDEAAAVEADWKFAAMVIDRLCLIVYTLFTIIASLTVLWTAPHVIVPWRLNICSTLWSLTSLAHFLINTVILHIVLHEDLLVWPFFASHSRLGSWNLIITYF